MESIKFDEVTNTIAENQDEYNTLYAHTAKIPMPGIPEEKGVKVNIFTVCFELTDEEITKLILTKKLWYQQLGPQYVPMSIHINKPI